MTDVVTEVKHADSNGRVLEVGNQVHVSVEAARTDFDYTTFEEVPGRTFDFGEVATVNEDGTVSVWWDEAGCSCIEPDGRVENPAELTYVDDDSSLRELTQIVFAKGYDKGVASNQRDLRDALGLPHPEDEKEN